jgi:N-sulfoglucosamine sulfohydrolase
LGELADMAKRPNVVLFISHDTGRFVSPYGVRTVHTPTFERLAAESVLFENAFCTAPQCSPSRAALVTGRYPHSNGVMGLTHHDYAWSLHPSERPVAKLFGASGYQTWLLGLQHETRDDRALGFDHSDLWFEAAGLPPRLQSALASRDHSRPFYCQLGCVETHRPWEMPGCPPDSSLGVAVPAYLHNGPETRTDLAAFQGMIRRLDQELGRLLDLLDQHGLQDNTILVVTTDHGIAMPMAKSTLRDPGIETLLLMRYPGGGWLPGQRVRDLVSNVDILPTLLEACGLEVPDEVQGTSFLPILQGQASPSRDAVYAEKTFHDSYDPMRCVRTERFKYNRYFEKAAYHPVPADILESGASRELGRVPREGFEELFDLEQDPDERNNLAENADYGQVCHEMRARLAAWMVETDDPLLEGPIGGPFYHKSVSTLLSFA